ncbi:hypothetical protein HPB48_012084 [Haemaphysalis longicornis]|uniref:Uncharacterized protein n=1 Tax=Haemaphysalis longicornis TaxID=44386 RepID=A0A9J6FYS1_HAELO|nr:hypothetical protein HPB48_012084 [Haemaphysalis longicornis]
MDKRNVFAFNVAWNKMMMFDNDYALTGKLCAARIAYPQVRFGIAAYDVIYDQGHTCPKFQLVGSPFGRVQTLGLVRRRTKDFYDSQDMQSCLGLFVKRRLCFRVLLGSKAEWKEANASTWPDGETGVTDHYDFNDYDFSMLQR